MAQQAQVEVSVRDFRWFREILVRVGDLIDTLATEDLSVEAERQVATLNACYRVSNAEDDASGTDLLPP